MSCVLVGNGPSAIEQEMGERIDSFDEVVRLNGYITKGYEKYVGSKVTHWGCSGIIHRRFKREGKVIGLIDPRTPFKMFTFRGVTKDEVELIPSSTVAETWSECKPTKSLTAQEAQQIALQTRSFPFGFRHFHNPWPTTGLHVMMHLVKTRGHVTIYGFDVLNERFREGHYYEKARLSPVHDPDAERRVIQAEIHRGTVTVLGA